MPPKLYLHIGINKTGTSAIQRYLSSHRAELVRESVLYPAPHGPAKRITASAAHSALPTASRR